MEILCLCEYKATLLILNFQENAITDHVYVHNYKVTRPNPILQIMNEEEVLVLCLCKCDM